MVRFLKYIRGYLRIRVTGFSPERFMNLCSNRGILLWDIVRQGEVYDMCISLKGFWELRSIVRKTGTRAAVLGRYGLPFFLPRLMRRKVFVAGLCLSVAFWILSSLCVWDIEITGNLRITEDMFQEFLRDNQVRVGSRKSAVDIRELEKQLRRAFPEITWASAKLDGTRLLIEIKENDAPIVVEKPEASAGMDLAAEYGGRIVSMIVRSGVPKAAIGDVVEEGAVLVEGKVPIYNEDKTVREYQYVDADADIVMEHAREFIAHLPFDHIEKEYTGREKTSHYLKWGDKGWKLPADRPFRVYDSLIRESRPAWFEKLSIPIFWGTVTHREYLNVEYEYTPEEVRTLLYQKLLDFMAELEEKGVQIMEKDVTIDTDGGSWVIFGEFLVQEPAGVQSRTARTDLEE